jgi:hypothetical protein
VVVVAVEVVVVEQLPLLSRWAAHLDPIVFAQKGVASYHPEFSASRYRL